MDHFQEENRFLRDKLARLSFSAIQRSGLLILEAHRWLGIQEIGGNNQGQVVGIFQRDAGIAPGDPWCMAFVQYCINHVDETVAVFNSDADRSRMAKGAHCLTVWNKTPESLKTSTPVPGSIAVWQHSDQASGHTGVVVDIPDNGFFRTIEGNTSPGQGVNRDGDGVFQKDHAITAIGSMRLLGFILPWGNV